jgi:hypothetical protein
MHPLKLFLSNLLGKQDFLFCYYGFQDVLELSNLLQMCWWMIKSFAGQGKSKYYSPSSSYCFIDIPKIKRFVLVNFGYFAKDILRKNWENLHLNCKTCFSRKKIATFAKPKNWKKKRGDLPNYNPINQAANPPSLLYDETDF